MTLESIRGAVPSGTVDINNCIPNADELLPDMAKLVTVAVDELYAALDGVSTEKAAQRLMIALADREGVSVEPVSKQYAIPRSRRGVADRGGNRRWRLPWPPPSLTVDQRE